MMMLKGIKKFFSKWQSPLELSPEREEEISNKIINLVSKYGLEDPAILICGGLAPSSTIWAQTTLLPIAPLLELMGLKGYEYTAFLNNKKNVQRILDKLEKLEEKKDRSFWR